MAQRPATAVTESAPTTRRPTAATRSVAITEEQARHAPSQPNKAALAFILWPLVQKINSEDEKRHRVQRKAQAPAPKPVTATRPRRFRCRICSVDGCTKRAKYYKKCWHHGGSVQCRIAECDNRAKTKGLCWSHGGGKLCSVDKCRTITVSNGLCWSHGGGKRCQISDCARPAYGNMEGLCRIHFQQKQMKGDTSAERTTTAS